MNNVKVNIDELLEYQMEAASVLLDENQMEAMQDAMNTGLYDFYDHVDENAFDTWLDDRLGGKWEFEE